MGDVPGQSLHAPPTPARPTEHRADAPGGPWSVRRRASPFSGLAADLVVHTTASDLPTGLERRLPRRAEQLWHRLRGDGPLPPAEAAAALLAPPFATCALLVTRPARGQPQVAYAGSEIGLLGRAAVGPAVADARPTAPIPGRLVALSLAAIAGGKPEHLDSDFDPDTPGPAPGILFRAVALPLAADASSGLAGLAVAVLSWRKLLSRAQTDALHSELRAAMGWLGSACSPGDRR
jgi:hypothetical protein